MSQSPRPRKPIRSKLQPMLPAYHWKVLSGFGALWTVMLAELLRWHSTDSFFDSKSLALLAVSLGFSVHAGFCTFAIARINWRKLQRSADRKIYVAFIIPMLLLMLDVALSR